VIVEALYHDLRLEQQHAKRSEDGRSRLREQAKVDKDRIDLLESDVEVATNDLVAAG
jgi:hypothetical protein